MFDTAVIGTGPAGLSAAINLKLHNKDIIWFGSEKMSEKIRISEKIANYPGIPFATGEEMAAAFESHRQQMGLEITDRMVSLIMPTDTGFSILADNDIYEARTIILATGVVTSKELPGENALVGRGVSYCATCDGFLHKGKTIAVLSTSERFEHEVKYLAELAEKVYFFPYYRNPAVSRDNVEVMDQKISSVNGDNRIESITLADGRELNVSCLFCMRDSIAPTTILSSLATEKNRIIVDRDMATNIPGAFACGDCTGTPYQIAKAVGEGNAAAHSAIKYLASV
ncbi:MAG: NAD(P)/FAD-dependent oxidoreductase [Parasporobacterium sp.]|nr:NAD(P)/FAD-dependent oxidoreductase [Parasporobacterium sp.]